MVQQFDEIYKNDENYFGELKKDKEIINYITQGVVLDLGCAQGRYTRPILEKRIPVIGVDTSRIAIDQLLDFSQANKYSFQAYCIDIRKFKFEGFYSTILSTMTLHLLDNKKEFYKIIDKMKSHTVINGYNFITMPIKSNSGLNFPITLENGEELYEKYEDWNIIIKDESLRNFKNNLKGPVARILAQRIR